MIFDSDKSLIRERSSSRVKKTDGRRFESRICSTIASIVHVANV